MATPATFPGTTPGASGGLDSVQIQRLQAQRRALMGQKLQTPPPPPPVTTPAATAMPVTMPALSPTPAAPATGLDADGINMRSTGGLGGFAMRSNSTASGQYDPNAKGQRIVNSGLANLMY